MLPNQFISKKKVFFFVLALVGSVSFACLMQPKYHNNANALTVLATVFSILAGFLIAVLAMVADDRSLRGVNWRQDVVYMELIQKDLQRHKWMFYLYLAVLSLAFMAAIDFPMPYGAQVWLERAVLGLAFFAMAWSFRLPGYLMRRHVDLLQQMIDERRDAQTK